MNCIKHNKKRNSALLYEFLIRYISKCLVEGNKPKAAKAVAMTKKYFSASKPLRNELNLFESIVKTQVKSHGSAMQIIDAICKMAREMNVRELDKQKSQLIKEINHNFGQDFYEAKVSNYTVLASVQTLLNETRNKNKLLTEVNRVKIQDTICEYLLQDKTSLNQNFNTIKVNPNITNTVYNFAVQRFHKKYDSKLAENQRRMITCYTNCLMSENKNKDLKNLVVKEIKNIKEKLKNIKDEALLKDKDISNKITECAARFERVDPNDLSEQNILNILQYMKLVEEIES